jgi:hypothetical protein
MNGGFARRSWSLIRSVATDPQEVLMKIEDRFAERDEGTPDRYDVDRDWEEKLHAFVGAPWPCAAGDHFAESYEDVVGDLSARGLAVGRGAFGGWGDAEPAFARAAWCSVLHLTPDVVVETGVARGVTSRFVLEALDRNERGHLWSIDLPPPRDRALHEQIGVAIPAALTSRWSYIRGSSRRRLASVLEHVGRVDLFLHDSRHSKRNVLFELDAVWPVLRPGGLLLIDDVDVNDGFRVFRRQRTGHQSLIGRAEPLEPDPARQDGTGVFGVLQKVV